MRYAFECERETWRRMTAADHLSPLQVDRPAIPGGRPYWAHLARLKPLDRVLTQMDEMLERLADKGLDVRVEREELASFRRRQSELDSVNPDSAAEASLYFAARAAKRRLMFRDPDLAGLERILFVKRHPYLASHNYSDVLDSQFLPGGGICVLSIPRDQGRLHPERAQLSTLFDSRDGIARDPAADFDAGRDLLRVSPPPEFRGPRGVLAPDGRRHGRRGAATIDRRTVPRLLPLPAVRRRIGLHLHALQVPFSLLATAGFCAVSYGRRRRESASAVVCQSQRMDARRRCATAAFCGRGRSTWTREPTSATRSGRSTPTGLIPELVYGNNTPNCYMNGREVPGTREICCTLVSHGGDHNGPIGLIDLGKSPFDSTAITNITPDVKPNYDMTWTPVECFRDPTPVVARLLPGQPRPRRPLWAVRRRSLRQPRTAVPGSGDRQHDADAAAGPDSSSGAQALDPQLAEQGLGQFTVADVYQGLGSAVPRGAAKYIRICQEVRSELEPLANGEYRKDHGPNYFDFYATPVDRVSGPFGWPSYVAKASLGIAPVEADGSASFHAPAGKVLYFELLDENYNELQRMRSVVQLQPGEQRSCIGCHEDRKRSPPPLATQALRRPASTLELPPWGDVPFSYEKVVQPVWDAKCVRCHDSRDPQGMNLTAQLDANRIPASYRTLISGGWVHYFDCGYAVRHQKSEPLSCRYGQEPPLASARCRPLRLAAFARGDARRQMLDRSELPPLAGLPLLANAACTQPELGVRS